MQIICCRDFGVFYLCLKNADLFTWGDGQSAGISVQFFHLLMVALRWAIWSLLHVCTVQWLVKDLKQVYMEIWGLSSLLFPPFSHFGISDESLIHSLTPYVRKTMALFMNFSHPEPHGLRNALRRKAFSK